MIVVDDDVDIYNSLEIEGALGSPLEPSFFENGSSEKLGYDATKPLGSTWKNYEWAEIPGYGQASDIHKYIQDG